jgi:diguanylate cyclase
MRYFHQRSPFCCSYKNASVEISHEDGSPLCLIITDIDHFKVVNDTHGHSAGDRVLKAFADLISTCVRANDLVARYGGEEFAIVLPRTPMGNAFEIAERVRAEFELGGGNDDIIAREFGRLTASFRVAEIRDGEPPSALIERADQMLYEAMAQQDCNLGLCCGVTSGRQHAIDRPRARFAQRCSLR